MISHVIRSLPQRLCVCKAPRVPSLRQTAVIAEIPVHRKQYFLLSVLKLRVFLMLTFADGSFLAGTGVCRVCLETARQRAGARAQRRGVRCSAGGPLPAEGLGVHAVSVGSCHVLHGHWF